MTNIIYKGFLMTIFLVISNHFSVFGFESNQDLMLDYDFTSKHPHICLNEGFSGFEKWGTWTDGENASLEIDLKAIKQNAMHDPGENEYFLSFLAHAYLPAKDSKIDSSFTLLNSQNEAVLQTSYEFSSSENERFLSFSLIEKDFTNSLSIEVKTTGCRSPCEHSSSNDPRLLGLGFKKMIIARANKEFLEQSASYQRDSKTLELFFPQYFTKNQKIISFLKSNHQTFKTMREENPQTLKWISQNYQVAQKSKNFLGRETLRSLPHLRNIIEPLQKIKAEKIFLNFCEAFINKEKTNKIPHLHHRFWLTDSLTPYQCLQETLEAYIGSLEVFPKDWKHIFWALEPEKLPKMIETLKDAPVSIEVRSLKPIIESMPGRYLFDLLYQGKHYSAAGNLVKRFVIYQMGGLSCDIGIYWKKDPTEFIDAFDRVINLTQTYDPDVGIYAAPPFHPVDKVFYKILDDFQDLPQKEKMLFLGKNIMDLTWIPTLSVLLQTETESNEKIFYWDQDETLYREWRHHNTWIKGILGNNSIDKFNPQ